MAEYDRYINLPGFDNVNRALTLLNVPKDIVGNLGDASVDAIANPDNLPMRERIGRGIEAGIGTLAYGAGPLIGKLIGQKAAQTIPETLTGFSGPQAAEEVVKDVVQDPSRRKFIGGVAATVPVAALAPDVVTDVVTKAAKTGSRAAINPLDMAMANIRVLRKKIDDQNQILNEMGSIDVDASAGQKVIDAIKARDDANRSITTARYEMVDEARDAIEEVDPKVFTGASDDAIEEIIGMQYDGFMGNQMIIPEHPNYGVIAQEIKRRGMDVAKDRNGISKYPNASVFIEDFYQPIKSQAQKSIEEKIGSGFLKPDSSMQMVRETPPDLVEEMRQMRIRSAERIYNDKVDELRKFTDFSEEKIQDIAERARQEELRRKAMGGPIEGIASLNDVARDMYRGPRGIGAYQQFTNGGGVDLNDFNFPPSREDRSQANFASYVGEPDKGPVIEGIESLANVEYEADMQNALSDNVSRLGFDPDIAFTIIPGFDPKKIKLMGDHYSPGPDRMGIDLYKGSSVPEVQAHEYRHRGLEKLLKHFKKYPFLYKEKYGQESFDFLSKMLEQRRIDLEDRIKGEGRSYPYSEFLHENFAEMFEQDYREAITGRYHQAEDGRVLVKGIHYGPGKEFETLDDWKEANPGVDLQLRITKSKNEDSRETPDVIKFRDYRVQRDRGELKEKVPKFEAVLQIQEAAGDLMKEIKEGKHKELFNKQQFSNGGAAMSLQVPQGISSLSETARLMYS